MRYREIREYQPGDDVRFIDWNVSARYAHPYSKVFEEERERVVLLMLDMSNSMNAGTKKRTKKELAIHLAAILSFSAIQNQDQVGAVIYGQQVHKTILPAKGRRQGLLLLRQLLTGEDDGSTTQHASAFQSMLRLSRRRSICFLISDFYGEGWEQGLRIAAKQHDLIAIHIYDSLEQELPQVGLLSLSDAETGKQILVDTHDAYVRDEYQKKFLLRQQYIQSVCRGAGAELISLRTDEDEVKTLQKFFLNRMQ